MVITDVDNGSIADNIGLSRGDVIMSIDQQPMTSPEEAAARAARHRQSPIRNALLLAIDRHG